MIICNASVLCDDGRLHKLSVKTEGSVITALTDTVEEKSCFDASSLIALPGFVDTHIHGFHGTEFAGVTDEFSEARLGLAKAGTTTLAPTVRALPLKETVAIEKHIINQSKIQADGAVLGGIHLEGPFISPMRSGAMYAPDEVCAPDAVNMLADAGDGFLKIMTIAPERENAEESIRQATKRNIKVSIGHTDATYVQAINAINAGASRMTHTFNAVRPFNHRETGALGACLTDDRVTCEVIADFVHLAPETVKIILRLKGCERVSLVSDAGMMTGLPDGEYTVNGHIRIVKGKECRNQEGRLAGSTCTILDGVQNLYRMGIPLADISRMASLNPAKALGMEQTIGSIAVGKRADILLFDREMKLHAVFAGGKQIL